MHMFITNTMEKLSFVSKRHNEPDEFDFKEWTLKAKISRENTNSRRFSASNLKSFRENEKSFRSHITISSTVSSPGYTIRDEINPSTYSFTTALKALQAKTMYTWEYLSPDHGLTLNSKWNEAEKYICNPLSGQVPLECLSLKTLSERSFRSRITMSAPLVYHPSQSHHFQAKSPITEHQNEVKITAQDIKTCTTKDVGTQSTPIDISLSSPSPAPTPTPSNSRPIKQSEAETEDSPVPTEKLISEAKPIEVKDNKKKQQYTKRNEGRERNKVMKMMMCSHGGEGGGCISLRNFTWRHKSKNNYENNNPTLPTFVCHFNASFRK